MSRRVWLLVLGVAAVGWIVFGALGVSFAAKDGDHIPVHIAQPVLAILTIATVVPSFALLLDHHRRVVLAAVAAAERAIKRRYARPVAWMHADWPTAPIPAVAVGRAMPPAPPEDNPASVQHLPSAPALAVARRLAKRVIEQEEEDVE
jgi:hypothetical protein